MRRRRSITQRGHIKLALITMTAMWPALGLPGCRSDGERDLGRTNHRPPAPAMDPGLADRLERQYVIGPAAARELNYRIEWQYDQAGRNVRHLSVQGDSLFAIDAQNYLSRVRLDNGQRLWRVAAAPQIDEIFGVNFINDRVYVLTGTALLELDAGTGTQIGKQTLDKVAATPALPYGQVLIYGSRDGQVVWHSYPVGYQWRAYQVSRSINVAPVLQGDFLAAVGADGIVMVVNASSASQYWSRELLGAAVSPPAATDAALYVSSLDQHLRAFDIASGRNLWKVLTRSPLTDAPVVIDDRLYQQIPAEGLACYLALPENKPGGEHLWTAKGVRGSVIMQRSNELFVWDRAGGNLTLLDTRLGAEIRKLSVPQARVLIVAGPDNNHLYAASEDGRVVKLVPRT